MAREAHSCSALCSAPGTCQIETSPQSVEATFTGRHETYQYTKVISSSLISVSRHSVVTFHLVYSRSVGFLHRDIRCVTACLLRTVAKRLQCVMIIPPGEKSHEGVHIHSKDKNPFHFCEIRYDTPSFSRAGRSINIAVTAVTTSAPCRWVRNQHAEFKRILMKVVGPTTRSSAAGARD